MLTVLIWLKTEPNQTGDWKEPNRTDPISGSNVMSNIRILIIREVYISVLHLESTVEPPLVDTPL